jgi:hypothetical protein
MAERRMFAKTIIDSDVFLDMPLSTQALYFHLSMRADDDGFINNPKKIMRMIGASQNEFELLLAKRYLLAFDSGIVVIKHWRIHNYIQKDRYNETKYLDEKAMIKIQDNRAYTECIQDGDTGKVRLGKVSIDKESKEAESEREKNPDYIRLATLLMECIENNDAKYFTGKDKTRILDNWYDKIRLLIEKDGRAVPEVECIIKWATSNDFWKSNILSAGKLREKFSTLLLQAKGKEKTADTYKPMQHVNRFVK